MSLDRRSWLASALAITATTSLLAADTDWPTWRGPKRDAISNEKGFIGLADIANGGIGNMNFPQVGQPGKRGDVLYETKVENEFLQIGEPGQRTQIPNAAAIFKSEFAQIG